MSFLWGLLIKGLSTTLLWLVHILHGNVGLSIILFTFAVRFVLAPLSYHQEKQAHFRQKSIAPRYGIIEQKYHTRDSRTVQKLFEHRYHLQMLVKKQNQGKHHYTLLFLFIQFIIIWGLVDSIHDSKFLYHGTFLIWHLGSRDPYFILPIVACILTACSQILINCVNHSWNHFSKLCLVFFPLFILIEGCFVTVALVLYWIALYIENIIQESCVATLWYLQNKHKKKLTNK